MRNALVYLLLIATLLPTISPWGTIAYYHANKEYIARVLCENRNRPQLHCDGKCYLAKKLKAQQDKQDKETTSRLQKTPNLFLFCQLLEPFQFTMLVTERSGSFSFTYFLNAYAAPYFQLLRPPCV